MTATPTFPAQTSAPILWLRRVEAWLDARGRGAWIAAMVIGFIAAWPLGLALLAYMLYATKFSGGAAVQTRPASLHGSSGNRAFDAYKEETLRRLQDEQDEFAAFLGRLREAKDKAEFDQFMADRNKDDRAPVQTERDDA
ncbi:DUF2852 domain-containing protein [Salipiger sp. IMCC34102]|uniref:DUF2852 domain-containing protein n=1 Tax=Salipiger sp. IMCC34102 TaxID=2510647 RepID=UPI00101C3CFB|nr:DUF2852 domain-containing protein [Salipiger sp. IMCC34102]RYH03346.1 DUF2852 domain-containing protein [Salipiger sp. IMCC34102]